MTNTVFPLPWICEERKGGTLVSAVLDGRLPSEQLYRGQTKGSENSGSHCVARSISAAKHFLFTHGCRRNLDLVAHPTIGLTHKGTEPLFKPIWPITELPIAVALTLAFLNVHTVETDVTCAGAISSDGQTLERLDSDLFQLCSDACRRHGYRFLARADSPSSFSTAISLPEELECEQQSPTTVAFWVAGGANLLQAVVSNAREPTYAHKSLVAFVEAHAICGWYPANLNHAVAAITPAVRTLPDSRLWEWREAITRLMAHTSCQDERSTLLALVDSQKLSDSPSQEGLAHIIRELLELYGNCSNGPMLAARLFRSARDTFGSQCLRKGGGPLAEIFREVLLPPKQSGLPESIANELVIQLGNQGLRTLTLFPNGPPADLAQSIADKDPSVTVIPEFVVFERKNRRNVSERNRTLGKLAGVKVQMTSRPAFQVFPLTGIFDGVVEYKIPPVGLSVGWREGLEVFPPSIDTLGMIGDFGLVSRDASIKTVSDIGCGTGILGLFASRYFPGVEEVYFFDIEPMARLFVWGSIYRSFRTRDGDPHLSKSPDMSSSDFLRYERNEITIHREKGKTRFRFLEGPADTKIPDCTSKLKRFRFDLSVVAPPYIPVVPSGNTPYGTATYGTGLLQWVITNGHAYTRRLVVVLSHLSMDVFEIALARARKRCKVDCQLLGKRVVSFLVPGVLEMLEDRSFESFLQRGLLSQVGDIHSGESFEAWVQENAPADFIHWYDSARTKKNVIHGRFFHVIRTFYLRYY